MTSMGQLIKVCECRIVLDANKFCEVHGLRRVYVLHIAAIRNLISVRSLNKIVVRILYYKLNKMTYPTEFKLGHSVR